MNRNEATYKSTVILLWLAESSSVDFQCYKPETVAGRLLTVPVTSTVDVL